AGRLARRVATRGRPRGAPAPNSAGRPSRSARRPAIGRTPNAARNASRSRKRDASPAKPGTADASPARTDAAAAGFVGTDGRPPHVRIPTTSWRDTTRRLVCDDHGGTAPPRPKHAHLTAEAGRPKP